MQIPAEAKCVFKGVIFDVYQWEQTMFDGSKETFEMLKRVNTVEVIAVCGDQIYMSYHSQPRKPNYYSLFGGRAEIGEVPLVTAQRELREESGMEADSWELFKVYQPLHKMDWDVYVYIAHDCRQVASAHLDPGEQIEIKAYSFVEFIKIVTSENYWGSELMLDVLRMKNTNTLAQFRERLLTEH